MMSKRNYNRQKLNKVFKGCDEEGQKEEPTESRRVVRADGDAF